MFTLFLLYGLIIFVLLVGVFFILYHILRYSLSRPLGYFGAVLFGLVFFCLLGINFLSFRSLEAQSSLPTLELDSLFEGGVAPITPQKNNPW